LRVEQLVDGLVWVGYEQGLTDLGEDLTFEEALFYVV
jgi:hypothetical protein